MAMFPVFIIGLIAGIIVASVYYSYKQETPSETKFRIQEATIIQLQEDLKALEQQNEELTKKLKARKSLASKRIKK